jgi:hypothetical protein
MALAKTRSHKHFQLDAGKLKRAQRALRAETETETIERALVEWASFWYRDRAANCDAVDLWLGRSTS